MLKMHRNGARWGSWQYDEPRKVLMDMGGCYEVDLEECRDGGEAMDWILQVAGKHWATSQYIGDLVRALDDLLGDVLREKG